jgi:hypothetical protein
MNEFEKSVRGYAAVGIPQVENAGNDIVIIRWGIEPNIVDGEQQGVKFYARSFKGMPTLGDLVDAMVRVQYTASNELALLRQRDSKPDEFAAYNQFVEACKAEAKTLLGSGNEAEAESENEGEGE